MTNERQMTGFTILITVVLFLAAYSSPGFGHGMTLDALTDLCEMKKADLKHTEEWIGKINETIKKIRNELSPEYLVSMTVKEVDRRLQENLYSLEIAKEISEENGETPASISNLEFYQDEVDFWSEVLTTKILRGSGIVKTKGYKYRQQMLRERLVELEKERESEATIKAEMKKLGCPGFTKTAGAGWTAIRKIDRSDIFFQYDWRIIVVADGNLRIIQTLVDTNKDFYRRFIGNNEEFAAKHLGDQQYKIDLKLNDPETGAYHRERIRCTITEKVINCTGTRKGPQGYWFGIRGRKLN